MSRAFVNDDAEPYEPPRRFVLPDQEDPAYPAAAALTLVEAARDGTVSDAEAATGYRWGDRELRPHVERLLQREEGRPEEQRDHRFIQVARRFLRAD